MDEWIRRFSFEPPQAAATGICKGVIGDLPEFEVRSEHPGTQLVRASLPFAPGALPKDLRVMAVCDGKTIESDFRELTLHPGVPPSVRRGLLSFPFDFRDNLPRRFKLILTGPKMDDPAPSSIEGTYRLGHWWITPGPDDVAWGSDDGIRFTAKLIAPARAAEGPTKMEVIERGNYFLWVRLLAADAEWPRIVDVRLDSLGTAVIQTQIQRMQEGDATAPDLGWEIHSPEVAPLDPRSFADGSSVTLPTRDGKFELGFPLASSYRRGNVTVEAGLSAKSSTVRYLRCVADEKVPFQQSAWRTAEFVAGPAGTTPLDELLRPALDIRVHLKYYAPLHPLGVEEDLSAWPELASLRDYTHEAILRSMRRGDDFGNITGFGDGSAEGGAYGMNRLNHAPAIFEEAWRTGDARLSRAAALWCVNMHDLSIWWGEKKFGGTRYNNASAAGRHEHDGDQNFMWRTNGESNFCTKGYDTFFYAYEETGDPRMMTALRWQLDYAKQFVHTDQGECRNIGDAADFMRLYRATGLVEYRDQALRLFAELRTKLSTGDLFDQGGKPLDPDPPFIADDEIGLKVGYAKPYIIGYALAGLPDLLRDFPDEPKLRDCIRAVADFLARSVDPSGGWRYPHPQSSYVIENQGIEHAMQICRAAEVLEERGEPIENLLDAVEKVLQARVNVYRKSGRIFSGLGGWEDAAGILKDGKKLGDLYKKPADRDPSRDYTEGNIGLGGSAPEGLVYFGHVLDFYLKHRPAERLFNADPQLTAILARIQPSPTPVVPVSPRREVRDYGMKSNLPIFAQDRAARMNFPLAWNHAAGDFKSWRDEARAALLKSFLVPPPRAAFDPEVIATEDRGTYEARKIAFNVSADNRISAYLLVPKGNGPFPAILALHDHGAHFSIGKEKVVRPFGVSAERMKDAEDWVAASYGGRFIGDELAKRGYVVFADDALFWGDRGRAEGVKYEAQETLAANMLQLGQSWAGVIAWDDIRCAEFIQSLPEVDPSRIGCVGLSMGSSRAWHLAAATDIIKAGAAICWMGDTPALMAEGNNQTRGQSAFSMIHPGLRNELDYPDAASIAAPKPMLFFNGEQDALFPVDGVRRAYEKMRGVWRGAGEEDKLVTKIWPVHHVFNIEMQDEAFEWMDRQLKPLN